MTKTAISEDLRSTLSDFLKGQRKPELVSTFLFFIEHNLNLHPVVYIKEKLIYQDKDLVIDKLEKEGGIWRETEIKIRGEDEGINDQTKKIYICPFTGKVFGDNTHPNPQDAIYDWVSSCPENTERVDGLRVKRFFISEDPEVIRGYAEKEQPKKAITKTVFSSVLSGKLFHSKESVVEDFTKNYLKRLSLVEVQNQNRFQIEETFLNFIQDHLEEEKITEFVEALAEFEEFLPYVEQWVEAE